MGTQERPPRVGLKHPKCPYCHDAVESDLEQLACNACRAWHHQACWREAGRRCASCGGEATGVGAAPVVTLGPPAGSERFEVRHLDEGGVELSYPTLTPGAKGLFVLVGLTLFVFGIGFYFLAWTVRNWRRRSRVRLERDRVTFQLPGRGLGSKEVTARREDVLEVLEKSGYLHVDLADGSRQRLINPLSIGHAYTAGEVTWLQQTLRAWKGGELALPPKKAPGGAKD